MSIPNYLTRLKSSGLYRYVFDKSQIPTLTDRNLTLVVGYAEKGPFNTPVYINDYTDFVNTFGKLSRRMEKKGIFFNRTAQQALAAGPILALNLKPFEDEFSYMISLNAESIGKTVVPTPIKVKHLYDINRFWKLDKDLLKEGKREYIQIAHTSHYLETNTVFLRRYQPNNMNITVGEWYSREVETEIPTYLEGSKFAKLSDFFAEVYVFRGQFQEEQFRLNGSLGNHRPWVFTYDEAGNLDNIMVEGGRVLKFKELKNSKKTDSEAAKSFHQLLEDKGIDLAQLKSKFASPITNKETRITTQEQLTWQPFLIKQGEDFIVNDKFRDVFGDLGDALAALAAEPTSNFIDSYQGSLLPDFRDATGRILSLEDIFNNGHYNHQMLMNFNTQLLDYLGENDWNHDGVLDCDIEITDSRVKESDGDPNTKTKAEVELWDKLELDRKANAQKKITNEDLKKDVLFQVSKLIMPSEGIVAVPGIVLKGYQYFSILPTDKENQLINKCLSVLGYKGVREALTNNVDVDYHYIVDSFNTYPGRELKYQLSEIAKKKDNAFAILNFCSIPDIIKYVGLSPRNIGGFEMDSVIKKGISLPSEGSGASWCAFYTQMTAVEGSTKFHVPSAGYVASIFAKKHTSRLPYYIVAGPNYGRIASNGLVGADYNYSRKDLDVLEPFGVNVILNVPQRGFIINSNQTAKQSPVSALSKVHVRELVIFIQNEIEDMLRNYHWELNTPTLRENVRNKANTILELVKSNGGVYEYTTKCDETNNTPEIIDNEMLILDVEIEPARGAGKMVQTLTIHKTGGLTSKSN